ncbi:MAG: hypothetical protein L0Z53_06520 [Acidobacteriales bacterium]|nr:hypothetical protein [Terriglobales bacterium]
MFKDGSGQQVVELRRHHDTDAQCSNKEFLVMRRTFKPPIVMIKPFGTYREATRYWDTEVAKLAATGMERRDARIVGFHEEG